MNQAPTTTDDAAAQTRRPGIRPHEEGLRVLFEQVLVALILAFIFRAFVLEAFVIPTGSMAPTLLGAHMRFRCPDCGWRFEVNFPTDSAAQSIPAAAWDHTYPIRCPNCAYRFARFNETDPENDAREPAVSYGDRILVLKHAYLLRDPRRWEVVVFKNPSRGGGHFEGLPDWSTEPYQQNYIKRLIGLPEERIMLVDGDVYLNSDKHTPNPDLRPEHFSIARKTDVAQSALWRVVYDDDHRPQGLERTYSDPLGPVVDPPWQMPWKLIDGQGWSVADSADGGGFLFDAPLGAGTLGFDADANPHTFALTDYLAYDINDGRNGEADSFRHDYIDRLERDGEIHRSRRNGLISLNPVSDLRLALFYERRTGSGPLELTFTKRGSILDAEIREDSVRLAGRHPDGTIIFEREAAVSLDFSRPHHIEFINADYRLQLRIDGRKVLETSDQDYHPDIASLVEEEQNGSAPPRPSVSITASDQVASIRHVSLWRDVYYTARDQRGGFYPYASPEDFPANVIRLGEGEYFTLGDNPLLSGDARSWIDGVSLPHEGGLWVAGGRIPERFMLGRAFFVYWPAGFRPAPRLPAIVPNFGEMRFIR